MKKIRYLDYYLLVPYLVLLAIGLVMVYSASAYWIKNQLGMAETGILVKQAAFIVVGLFLTFIFFHLRLAIFRVPWVQALSLAVTYVLLIYLVVLSHVHPETTINGASAWIPIGPFNLQPSELAKLVLILYLAHMFTNRQDQLLEGENSLKKLRQPIILVGGMILLVLLQPDTGGMMILSIITFVMVASSGIASSWGLKMSGIGAFIVSVGYFIIANVRFPSLEKYYQFRRLVAVMHPFAWKAREGNQIVNSFYAINHGGLFGVGLGNSTQKLGYLPEPYTDFILAIITEELGVIGALVVVGLIFFLILRILLIGIRSKNAYHSLIAYGIATMMFIQASFNIGAVLGVLPVTGVTLPFISYGGSSLLILAMAMGIMLNISAAETKLKQEERHA